MPASSSRTLEIDFMPRFGHWVSKFTNAFRGIGLGIKGQSSFLVHFPMALAVVVLAWFLNCNAIEWSILLLCIGFVIAIELINSSIESLAHALCKENHPGVGRALDIASAAVLVASIAAASVGGIILLQRLLDVVRDESARQTLDDARVTGMVKFDGSIPKPGTREFGKLKSDWAAKTTMSPRR
jgi:diacylglycerol kinase